MEIPQGVFTLWERTCGLWADIAEILLAFVAIDTWFVIAVLRGKERAQEKPIHRAGHND